MSTRKYRPYFTLAELKHLHSLCHANSQIAAITSYLGKYISDIEAGHRIPNHINQPSLEQKLGFSPSPLDQKTAFEKEQERRYLADEMSPEEEIAYVASLMK